MVTSGNTLSLDGRLTQFWHEIQEAARRLEPKPDEEPFAGHFSPAFVPPPLSPEIEKFFEPARMRLSEPVVYNGNSIKILDLTCDPATRTTKSFASYMMVARAISHIRSTGENIVMLSSSSGNKASAIRAAVCRALESELVSPTQLRIISLVPMSSFSKMFRSPLSDRPEWLKHNPIFLLDSDNPEEAKGVGRRAAQGLHQVLGHQNVRVWYTLDLRNYQMADAARAFFLFSQRNVSSPQTGAGDIHVHAVSSAFGLLGFELGWSVLVERGEVPAEPAPGYFLVQHLATPDMVVHLLSGGFSRAAVPEYEFDGNTGMYHQTGSPHFPSSTFEPNEVVDPTFWTTCPPTSPTMSQLIRSRCGGGIVVSLKECIDRFGWIRAALAEIGIPIPQDPRRLGEWSLVMAFTGILNALDRGLVPKGRRIIVHASGSYERPGVRRLDASQYRVAKPDAAPGAICQQLPNQWGLA